MMSMVLYVVVNHPVLYSGIDPEGDHAAWRGREYVGATARQVGSNSAFQPGLPARPAATTTVMTWESVHIPSPG